jgi:hypothetical protein
MRIFMIAAVLAFGTPALAQPALTRSGPANGKTCSLPAQDVVLLTPRARGQRMLQARCSPEGMRSESAKVARAR